MPPYAHIALAVQLPPMLQSGGFSLSDNERRAVGESAGAGVRQAVRENFYSRGKHFYMRAADATDLQVTSSGEALVLVRQVGVHLRWKGGVVTPRQGNTSSKTGQQVKLLAIPLGGQKKSPGFYRGVLAFLPIKGRPKLKGLLVQGRKGKAKRKYKNKPAGRAIIRKAKDAKAIFALVTSTTHSPDETVIPKPGALHEAACAGAALAINEITKHKK